MNERISLDLNEPILEEPLMNDVQETTNVTDVNGQSKTNNFDEPFVGQCFLSEEEAYVFYQNYARMHGFSIRKGRFVNKKGERRRRDFFCHREGKPKAKVVDYSKQQRNRGSTKCECKAHMRITLRKINDIFLEEWQVTTFVVEHNHELLSTQEVRFLPSYRNITKEDEERILMLKEGGLSVRQIMRVMELEKKVRHGELNFLMKDVHNLFTKCHKVNSQNDVNGLLEYCKDAKNEHPNFQYTFTVDGENKLENIFWSHAHCFDWYEKYGDVVVFDTTYKVNSYEMPFGVFVGINNHGRTVLFGCALLRNETTSTFEWLFKNFISLMKKSPKAILTDQDLCMTEAIATQMPSTKHAFCIWHITTKFSGWFTSVLRSEYSNWCSEFYNLYRLDTVEEFEQQWPVVTTKYNLHENKHVIGLYQIKSFWVPAYLREFFFGGMTTTGRSESINAFIKRFVTSRTCLSQFIKQVDLAIEDVEHKEMHDNMLEKYNGLHVGLFLPLEEQGHRYYTPYAFNKFQAQIREAFQYSVQEESHVTFTVKHHKTTRWHKVIWDGKVANCTCKNFEFVGILCRHILSVLVHKDCFEIPGTYWLSRWSREEVKLNDRHPSNQQTTVMGSTSTNNGDLLSHSVDLVQCPPISKTKGRPKNKRMKGGKELMKQVRHCGLCKCVGHNISRCPEKENFNDENNDTQVARKKKKISHENNPILCLKL